MPGDLLNLQAAAEPMRDHAKAVPAYCVLCVQGMCYSEPELTGEDKAWGDGPSDIEYKPEIKWPQKTHPEVHVSNIYARGGWSSSAEKTVCLKFRPYSNSLS